MPKKDVVHTFTYIHDIVGTLHHIQQLMKHNTVPSYTTPPAPYEPRVFILRETLPNWQHLKRIFEVCGFCAVK